MSQVSTYRYRQDHLLWLGIYLIRNVSEDLAGTGHKVLLCLGYRVSEVHKNIKKLPNWAHNIISQLNSDRQLLFPCILNSKYACDKRVVGFLRHGGLGNSSSMLRRQLEALHGSSLPLQSEEF